MGEFFKGWRRKVGFVTLVLACVVVSGWFRSFTASDFVTCPTGTRSLDCLASVTNSLVWFRVRNEDLPADLTTPSWNTDDAQALDEVQNIRWRFRFWGFGVYNVIDGDDMRGWVIPYWSLAIPLTLLSAYLLLWKPRKRTGPDHA